MFYRTRLLLSLRPKYEPPHCQKSETGLIAKFPIQIATHIAWNAAHRCYVLEAALKETV